MKIEKAHWSTDGDSVRVTMPLQKVDTERRIVSGFATLDNDDLHGDVVTAEASAKAFKRFRGNVRLMHQPIPAGRLVNFREDEYYDPETQKFYNGIYVDTYVSEGAENVWKMVLDGTLTGFSIGGSVKDHKTEFNKELGKPVRYITDYEMIELSLVDNPANQLSNIFSIQKTADGQETVEGMITMVKAENVFYCKKDHDPVAIVGGEESKTCVECNADMKNIGWFENDGGDRTEKVNSIIEKFEADLTKGGENMADEKTVTEVAEEEATQVTAEEVTPKGDETVVAPEEEEAATATDVVDENVTLTGTGEVKLEEAKEVVKPEFEHGDVKENPLTKMFEELAGDIKKSLEENSTKTAQLVSERTAELEKQLGELAGKHNELSEKFGALTEKVGGVEKSLDSLDKSGAFKKSADLGGDTEDSSFTKSNEKKVWRGSIFSAANLG